MITLYVLEGSKGRRYVGITNNLERRLAEHSGGSHSGHLIGEFELLHTESFQTYVAARQREKFLKSGKGREWLKGKFSRSRPAAGG